MSKPKWRPANAAEATSNVAAFIEFARATGAADLTPAEIPAFRAENPAEFRALIAAFAGLDNAAMHALGDEALDRLAHRLLIEDERPDG